MLEELRRQLSEIGLSVLGLAPVTAADGLPLQTGTLVLIGNQGGQMWPFFEGEGRAGPDPMNQWTRSKLSPLAEKFAARALYPFDGPPWYPFQSWAKRSGACWASPIQMLIHQEAGLWHAYRAAFLFAEELEPAPSGATSPCLSCDEQPCLSGCPVEAFAAGSYDAFACAAHVAGADDRNCSGLGCAARRACPYAPDVRYSAEQASFHMAAFLAAMKEAREG